MSDRALIFPGLVPLTEANLNAVVKTDDEHLQIAARTCSFDPATVLSDAGYELSSTVHEALLAVAILRRIEEADGRQDWRAFGGLSAGCLPALLAAGAISEETTFQLINAINSEQIALKGAGQAPGLTLAVLTASHGDAMQLVEILDDRGYRAWLSVDLGDGLVAISVNTADASQIKALLNRLGVAILDMADRPEHCPYAVPDRAGMTKIVEEAEILPPQYAVVSPVTGERLGDTPAALRKMLVDQWFDTASLPRLIDGLCGIGGINGVDLVSPAESVYVTRVRKLVSGRATHQLLQLAD